MLQPSAPGSAESHLENPTAKKVHWVEVFLVFRGLEILHLSHQLWMCSFLKGSYDVKHATKCNAFCGASSQCRHWCRSHCISLWPEDLSQKGDISRVCHGTSMPYHCKTRCCRPFCFPASFLLWGYRDPILTTHPHHNWYSIDMDPPGNKHIPWKVNLKMIFLFKMWDTLVPWRE